MKVPDFHLGAMRFTDDEGGVHDIVPDADEQAKVEALYRDRGRYDPEQLRARYWAIMAPRFEAERAERAGARRAEVFAAARALIEADNTYCAASEARYDAEDRLRRALDDDRNVDMPICIGNRVVKDGKKRGYKVRPCTPAG